MKAEICRLRAQPAALSCEVEGLQVNSSLGNPWVCLALPDQHFSTSGSGGMKL